MFAKIKFIMLTVIMMCAIVFLIAGCTPKQMYIDTSIETPRLNAPDPRPLVLNNVEWLIISDKNLDEYIPKLMSGELVIIGVDAEDYKLLSIDQQKIQNYIRQQKNVIAAYRDFYEPREED